MKSAAEDSTPGGIRERMTSWMPPRPLIERFGCPCMYFLGMKGTGFAAVRDIPLKRKVRFIKTAALFRDSSFGRERKMTSGKPVIFEVVPHPHHRGEWLLKPTRGAPFGLWYRERAHAVSYAEWVAREVECAEILIRNSDGSVERRLMERPT